MPMPIDIEITYNDNSKKIIYIPLSIMRGEKNFDNYNFVDILPDWEWVNQTYRLDIDNTNKNIKSIIIDPSEKLADVNPENNKVIYK